MKLVLVFGCLALAGCNVPDMPDQACRTQTYNDPTVKEAITERDLSVALVTQQKVELLNQLLRATYARCMASRGGGMGGGVQPVNRPLY